MSAGSITMQASVESKKKAASGIFAAESGKSYSASYYKPQAAGLPLLTRACASLFWMLHLSCHSSHCTCLMFWRFTRIASPQGCILQFPHMSTDMCIPGNPDIAGIGVRLATYAQNLLCFISPFWALVDGKVTETELESVETQATTNLALAFAILISAMVQARTLGLTNYHASIILDMSWMNNTNAFIYFLLYVQHRSQFASGSGHLIKPTFSAWARHIKRSFLPGKGDHTSIAESGESGELPVQAVANEMPAIANPNGDNNPSLEQLDRISHEEVGNHMADVADARTAAKNLVKRLVLLLGSLHLSLMAVLGLWLWSDIRDFGNMRDTANNCAADHALISILGSHIPFASGSLRIFSFVIYSLFLIPALNLFLPTALLLGFHYCAHGSPPAITVRRQSSNTMPRNIRTWERYRDPLIRWLQEFIARWWNVIPPVLGLVFLLAVNLVFIVDIELTLRQNRGLQGHDEAEWGFGQILAMLLLFMPLRDLAETIFTRRMQKELNLGLENAIGMKSWDAVLTFVARRADPNLHLQGGVNTIREVCLSSDRLDVVRALLDAGADPNIECGPKRDTKIIQQENKACLQLLRDYDNHYLDGAIALKSMAVKGYGAGVKLLLAAGGIDVNAEGSSRWVALIWAASEGKEALIRLLLAVPGIDVNAPDTKGRTPLSFAAMNGDEAVAKLLLAVPGIDVNAPGTNGQTPLSFAAMNGHEEALKLLLTMHGIDVKAPDTNGRTPLSVAAMNGHKAVVKLLLAVPGIDVNAPDSNGRTPLSFAAINGHEAAIKLLLAVPGVDANAPDTNGRTPLSFAAMNGHEAAVKLLLAVLGIDVNAPDMSGRTPLSFAAMNGRETGIKPLLAVPAIDVNAPDTNGRTPLSVAAGNSHETVVKLLLAVPGIDINVPDTKGRTPLSFAATNGHEAAVEFLLAVPGIDVNAPDTNGRTPLSVAVGNSHEAVVKLLLATPGIDINVPDTDGRTPLIFAARYGHEAVVKLLLSALGINVNARDADGRTPLIFAVRIGHEAVVKHLLPAPGIDVNVADTSGWTASIWAAFRGETAIVKHLCAVPEIIINVADVKRCLKQPPSEWQLVGGSKHEQDTCVRILEESEKLQGGGAQDRTENLVEHHRAR
ncbi:hypothetical protein D9611_008290 [Ephemerocybe angulata]|uniref:Uncharacterized protein n=1 Tax=Ephemerocybe angulata TaxID=980116 RepID=A0A8H5F517_9AGAR|nr:hypothetical protein D9611_008290 [Tulosesus angulatus]